MSVREQVRRFIVENFLVTEPAHRLDDLSLIEEGWIDSTGILELITFLESEFGIRIADTETVPENLGSIAHIAAFVERKGAAPNAPDRA